MNTEKIKRVMANVMAAFNAVGVEYDTNVHGCNLERQLSELNGEETIDNERGFLEFLTRPHYAKPRGFWWADDNKYVVIQFSRRYEMDAEDWDDWAGWCGCENPEEAQYNFGDPSPSYIFINIRVPKGSIDSFVRRYARYCWD